MLVRLRASICFCFIDCMFACLCGCSVACPVVFMCGWLVGLGAVCVSVLSFALL